MPQNYGILVGEGKNKIRHYPPTVVGGLRYTDRMRLRIKEIRKQKKLTQKAVADLAGLSPSYFADLERGDSPINSIRLEAIARALDVHPSELIEGGEDPADVKLREDYSSLSDEQKAVVRQLVASLAAKE